MHICTVLLHQLTTTAREKAKSGESINHSHQQTQVGRWGSVPALGMPIGRVLKLRPALLRIGYDITAKTVNHGPERHIPLSGVCVTAVMGVWRWG